MKIATLARAIADAVARARTPIATVAVTYLVTVVIGVALVHGGDRFALDKRDAVVADARSSDTIVAFRSGDRLRAGLLDFAANLVLGGVTSTIAGVAVVGVYPIVAYRGWIGGIVSVDAAHLSRLGDPAEAFYYLATLLLQLIPYSIAGGVGVHVGIGAWRAAMGRREGRTWLGIPTARIRDAALSYGIIAPLFLVASLFEFLAR